MRDNSGIIAQLVDDYLNGTLNHPFTLFSNRIMDTFRKTHQSTAVYDLLTYVSNHKRPEHGSVYAQLMNFLKSGIGHAVPSLNASSGALDGMMHKLAILTTAASDPIKEPPADYWNHFRVILDDEIYGLLATEIKRREHMGIPVVRHDWGMDELPVNPLPTTTPLEKKKIELSIKVNGFDVALSEVRVLHQALKSHIEYIDGVGKEAVAVMAKFGFTNQYEEMHEFASEIQSTLEGLLEQKRERKPLDPYIGPVEMIDLTTPDKVGIEGDIDLSEFTTKDYVKVLFTEYPSDCVQPMAQRIMYYMTKADQTVNTRTTIGMKSVVDAMVKDGIVEIVKGERIREGVNEDESLIRLTKDFREIISVHAEETSAKTSTKGTYITTIRKRLAEYPVTE